jgi:glutamate-5-semialdehyde dehydrogenase
MNRPERVADDTAKLMRSIGEAAKAASRRLAIATADEKNAALIAAAKALRAATQEILSANAKDIAAAKAAGRPAAFVDRLMLDEKRIAGIASGLEEIAALADPVGTVLAEWTRPNGLKFQRVRVPLGTIGIIYESRPNVTADAGGLSLKAGNAAILRGGSESHHSRRQSSSFRRPTAPPSAKCCAA